MVVLPQPHDWRWQLRNMLSSVAELERYVELTEDERAGLSRSKSLFRVGVTPYYASLMDRTDPWCPIRMQAIPSARELEIRDEELVDPLGEQAHSPTPAIVHKYPDRVLLLAVDRCAIYCRHCNRRRLVGGDAPAAVRERDTEGVYRKRHAAARGAREAGVTGRPVDAPTARDELDAAIDYIARTPRVRDVLLSGGDPLLLSTDKLDHILRRLRAIDHVEIIRLGTRVPVVLPMRVDAELAAMLREHQPVYVNTHFNHPKEITDDARAACATLVDAGVPVGNQTVLLRGVNSSVRCMRALMRELLKMRVRPYYLFQGDTVVGTDHLRTPVDEAIRILDGMRGWISGMAIPHLVIDAPGGGGKIPIGPRYLLDIDDDVVRLRNYRGDEVRYPQPRARACAVPYDDVYFAGVPDDDDREGAV